MNIYFKRTGLYASKNPPALSQSQIEQFFSSLDRLFSAGIPLVECLLSIKEHTPSTTLRHFAHIVYNKVYLGHSLSSAIKASGINMNPTYYSLLKTGEASGKLDVVIAAIHQLLVKRLALRKKLISALLYPLCILVITLLILAVFFIAIIPQFKSIYEKSQQQLPCATRLLLHLSDYFILYSFSTLLIFVILTVLTRYLYQHHIIVKKYVQKVILNLPIFSRLIILQQQYMFAFIMQLSLQAGITLEQSLLQAKTSSFLSIYQESIDRIICWVTCGKSLSGAMKACPLLPARFVYFLSISEQSGCLDLYFTQLSTDLNKQLDQWVQNLSQLFEPFIIVVLGSIIGFMVVAMYLPIFELGSLF